MTEISKLGESVVLVFKLVVVDLITESRFAGVETDLCGTLEKLVLGRAPDQISLFAVICRRGFPVVDGGTLQRVCLVRKRQIASY